MIDTCSFNNNCIGADALALRIDDIGASSKIYEQYSKRFHGLGNFLFLKRMPYFRAWGPYNEMQASDWLNVRILLEKYSAKLTVGVTASWVESDGSLVPYHLKWPNAYSQLMELERNGLVEIACHGLTHCVLNNNLFMPKLFTSNRKYHREFWDWIPDEIHHKNLKLAKSILEDAFKVDVTTLIPPGNVFSEVTIDAAKDLGFKVINCATESRITRGLRIVGNESVFAFHDREVMLYGISWLEDLILKHIRRNFVFVKDFY